jgi:heme/copper-type cytochrome/quinol oxidase subunit 2
MTPTAWVFMIAVWTIIIVTTVYCFYKLVTSDQQLEHHEEGQIA